MDLEQRAERRWHFALGPVERWIVTLVVILFGWGAYKFGDNVLAKLDKVGTIDTRTLLMQQKLDTMQLQQLGVPDKLIDHEARLKQAEKEIDDLKQTKGLR